MLAADAAAEEAERDSILAVLLGPEGVAGESEESPDGASPKPPADGSTRRHDGP
jgi:hypothetical protein